MIAVGLSLFTPTMNERSRWLARDKSLTTEAKYHWVIVSHTVNNDIRCLLNDIDTLINDIDTLINDIITMINDIGTTINDINMKICKTRAFSKVTTK